MIDWKLAAVGAALYVFVAMVTALPDEKKDFDLYTWGVHVARSLLNMVPPKYKDRISQPTKETGV